MTVQSHNFTRTDQQRPDKGRLVEWISPAGIHERGRYEGGLIWFPEGSPMYVYYTPEFWRYVNE